MPKLVTDYFTAEELTDLSRELQNDTNRPADTDYRFQRLYLPSTWQHDVEYRVKAGNNGIPQTAKFRAFDSEAPIGNRPGFKEQVGELLPLGLRIFISEAERIKMRRNAEDLMSKAIIDCTVEGTLATIARMEKAIVDTWISGRTTLTGERGVTQEADWGRPASHSITSATPWATTDTATPVTDLENAAEIFDGEGTIIMSTPTFRMMQRSKEIRTMGGTMLGVPNSVGKGYVNELLGARGFPAVDLYDAKIVDDKGVERRILPTGYVLFAPPAGSSAAGQTVWGITPEAQLPEYEIEEPKQPGIVSGHYEETHPVQTWVNTAALGFPAFANPKRTLALNVGAV